MMYDFKTLHLAVEAKMRKRSGRYPACSDEVGQFRPPLATVHTQHQKLAGPVREMGRYPLNMTSIHR